MNHWNRTSWKQTAARVSAVSMVCNLLLLLLKGIAAIAAGSDALLSDAAHSAADVLSSLIVYTGLRLAAKERDREHPYGHERLECVAVMVLAMVLCITGVCIGLDAMQIIAAGDHRQLEAPGSLAAAAALVSILVKEMLFWYTNRCAKLCHSGALRAEAWHHQSDVLSSVGAFVGILGARMGLPVLDPLASLLIGVFLLRVAYDSFRDAASKLVDHACDRNTQEMLLQCILKQPGVLEVSQLRTRIFGSRIYVEAEICADGAKTLAEGSRITGKIRSAIAEQFPEVKDSVVSVRSWECVGGLRTSDTVCTEIQN